MRLPQNPSWINTDCKYCGRGMILHYSTTTHFTLDPMTHVRLYCLNCHFAVEIEPDDLYIGEIYHETTRGKITKYNSSLFQEGEEE
tara:strand:+ start:297 stop:554 length:258 start_codon:yes stop_codon:yes gene_type:complete